MICTGIIKTGPLWFNGRISGREVVEIDINSWLRMLMRDRNRTAIQDEVCTVDSKEDRGSQFGGGECAKKS